MVPLEAFFDTLDYNDILDSDFGDKNICLPAQIIPSAKNPLRHLHVYDPIVLLHIAFVSQV